MFSSSSCNSFIIAFFRLLFAHISSSNSRILFRNNSARPPTAPAFALLAAVGDAINSQCVSAVWEAILSSATSRRLSTSSSSTDQDKEVVEDDKRDDMGNEVSFGSVSSVVFMFTSWDLSWSQWRCCCIFLGCWLCCCGCCRCDSLFCCCDCFGICFCL